MPDWIVAEPGRLVLSGTRFSVRYNGSYWNPWRVYDGEDDKGGWAAESCAKSECERRHRELVEVGLE